MSELAGARSADSEVHAGADAGNEIGDVGPAALAEREGERDSHDTVHGQ